MGQVCGALTGRGSGALDDKYSAPPPGYPPKPGPNAAEQQQPLSQLTQAAVELPGRRKSLLVGCNYEGTRNQLSGCVNDVCRMREVLRDQWGFPEDSDSQLVLLDGEGSDSSSLPTLQNMRAAIRWLVEGAQTGDVLFFHYSGHGGREKAAPDGPPTTDGYHETLVPLDFEEQGMLLDTELFKTLIRPLPTGCRLTCILDSCHSGGALNLPYLFVGSQQNLEQALRGQAYQLVASKNWLQDLKALKEGHQEGLLKDAASLGLGLWHLYQQKMEAEKQQQGSGGQDFLTEETSSVGLAVGEVVAITGCRSDQTSADVADVGAQFHIRDVSGGASCGAGDDRRERQLVVDRSRSSRAGGALTSALVEALRDGAQQQGQGQEQQEDHEAMKMNSYLALLERIRGRLGEEGFAQVPQVCSSLQIELRQRFSLSTAFLPLPTRSVPEEDGEPSAAALNNSRGGFDGSAAMAQYQNSLASTPHGQEMLRRAQAEPVAWAVPLQGPVGDLPVAQAVPYVPVAQAVAVPVGGEGTSRRDW